MFTVVEKVENLRTSSLRHKAMTEVDRLIECKKVFTLADSGSERGRNKTAICDLYDLKGDIVLTFTSTMCSYGDAIRHIGRQIKHYNVTKVHYYTGEKVNAKKLKR